MSRYFNFTLNKTYSLGTFKERTTFNIDWRKKVIIVCTITAGLECLVVIFTIVYWNKIRWFLSKITCPCVSESLLVNRVYEL